MTAPGAVLGKAADYRARELLFQGEQVANEPGKL